ncbi:MAG: hypothetical protein A3G75_00135 [Verrucomicrobia bacterium RIFCSPLOWO2_12_FULL_64_8]|nr:MAG: hypothetical protein A3G75_00135 [Verrucomicrobia bacterium RIFCSPLOWO2_12_FULL_64_8]
MKTATVRQLRNQFPSVLRLVRNGETIAITLRRKVVATLAPPPQTSPRKRAWPGLDARMKTLLGQPMMTVSGAQIVAEDREQS